jgi:hypothetical protein
MLDTQRLLDSFELSQGLSDVMDEGFTDIISSNIIHDRYQFESKFDFDLKPHGTEDQKKYEIDVYFFIPKDMGINSDTYARDNFYADLTNFLRIQTPEFFHWGTNLADWNLPALEKYVAVHFMTSQRQSLAGVAVQETKLFGCFMDMELKKLQTVFKKIIHKNKDILSSNPRVAKGMKNKITQVYNLIQLYRNKYVTPVRQGSVVTDQDVRRSIFLVNEYISYRVETVLLTLLNAIKELDSPEITQQIHTIFSQESSYRNENQIINLDGVDDEATRERYYYRLGLLKKYVLEVLYLQRKNIKKEKAYRNMIAAFGAALAAIWAGMADIQRIQMVGNPTGNDAWVRLVAILFLGVIAYVFKDRIKELTKEYVNLKLKRYLPDFDILMFYKYFDKNNEEKKQFMGSCKEFFRYLDKQDVVPEIAYIRDISNRSELDPARDEVILHYSKKINFPIHSSGQNGINIEFIRDMARFDISEFLNKLDNPKKTLSYFDSLKGSVLIEAPKVYHINIVFRYASYYQKNKVTHAANFEFERVRLVLNKKGIVRIEEVLPRGVLSYSEND